MRLPSDIALPPLKLALQEHAPTRGVGSLSHLGVQVGTADENVFFELQAVQGPTTPEPATFGVVGLLLVGIGVVSRRKFRT